MPKTKMNAASVIAGHAVTMTPSAIARIPRTMNAHQYRLSTSSMERLPLGRSLLRGTAPASVPSPCSYDPITKPAQRKVTQPPGDRYAPRVIAGKAHSKSISSCQVLFPNNPDPLTRKYQVRIGDPV